MNFKFRESIKIMDFLKRVNGCTDEVFLKTDEGDVLNLKSQLSKFVLLSATIDSDFLDRSIIECSSSDALILSEYLEVKE